MNGIFIPNEILKIKVLGDKERMILSIYRYYTVEGNLHCCTLSNKDICNIVGLSDTSNLRKIKKHLKDLGYIKTDGGIKVTYLGVSGDDLDAKEGEGKNTLGGG